ncbi:hypothetical protein BH24PSE2_BH24PSE2_12680 [soil metagenome]
MEKTVDQIIAEVFEMDATNVSDELTPESIDRWDSLNHFRLVTALEQAYNIRLSMGEIQSLESVGRIREVVDQRAGERAASA